MARRRRQFNIAASSSGRGPLGGSGMYPLSGTVGEAVQTSGTHMLKTQELYAEVQRVPTSYSLDPQDYQLSGNLFPNAKVVDTGLMATIWGHVKVEKIGGIFQTSSYTQTQRFAIDSADSPSSINGFGTSGTLLTVSAGIERRLWNDATDVESYCPFTFKTWHIAPGAPGGYYAPAWFTILEDQKVAWYDNSTDPNEDISCSGIIGHLWGEFDPSGTIKDGTIVPSVIDRFGTMTKEGLICDGWIIGPGTLDPGWPGCSAYDINMHQYD